MAQLASDSNLVETGNKVVLHLTLKGKPAGNPDLSAWNEVVPKDNRLKESDWTSENGLSQKDITVIFFEADSLIIPPARIPLPNGDTAVTNTLCILVLATPAPDEIQDMAPVRDILREEKVWTDYWPFIAVILAVAAMLLVGYLIVQYRKNKGAGSRSIHWPPHELALRKIRHLQQQGLWESGKTREYCDELTYIIREYLELRFGIPALECTSTELTQKLKDTGLSVETVNELDNILMQADLVKFAKGTPPPDFGDSSMQFSIRLIDSTKPVPVSEKAPL